MSSPSGNPWVAEPGAGWRKGRFLSAHLNPPSLLSDGILPTDLVLERGSVRVFICYRVDPSFTTLERKMIAFRITSVKEIAGD
jgi:hypothetical protein